MKFLTLKRLLFLYCSVFVLLSTWSVKTAGFFGVMSNAKDMRFLAVPAFAYATIILLWGLMLWRSAKEPPLRRGTLAVAFLVVAVASVLIIPSSSCDFYHYLSTGILQGKYHQNPFTSLIGNLPAQHSPSIQAVGILNRMSFSPYGYSFMLLLKAVYLAAGGNEILMFLLLKTAMLTGLGLTGVLIECLDKYSERPSSLPVSLLLPLNPVLLIEYVINGHNDILVICLVTAGLYALHFQKWVLSLVFFLFSMTFKILIAFSFPFLLLYFIKNRVPFSVYVCGVVLLAVSLLPYTVCFGLTGIPPGISSLLNGFYFISPVRAFVILWDTSRSFGPDMQGKIVLSMKLLWMLVIAICLFWYALRKGKRLSFYCLNVENAYLLYFAIFINFSFWPWYIVYLILFACLSPGGRARIVYYSVIAFGLEFLLAFLFSFHKDMIVLGFYSFTLAITVLSLLLRKGLFQALLPPLSIEVDNQKEGCANRV